MNISTTHLEMIMDNIIKFELNKEYTKHGLTLTFVRRTAKCIFDSNGTKYLINTNFKNDDGVRVENVMPWGQHVGHFFAK